MESSRLSKILRGERPVSPSLLKLIARKLHLSPLELESYQTTRGKRKPQRIYLTLAQDAFEIIEDSRHYLLLELMKTEGFRSDTKWLSRVLDVSVMEVQAYIDRLMRVGILEIASDGSWHDRSEGFSTHILSETETTAAHRRAQLQILQLAIRALENISFEKRDQSSMMMATHSSRILEAKKRITAFRRELTEYLEQAPTKDSVYQLSISLFPLTEIQSDKNKH
jgi:uncharacterized protein (TIGR02147 family)